MVPPTGFDIKLRSFPGEQWRFQDTHWKGKSFSQWSWLTILYINWLYTSLLCANICCIPLHDSNYLWIALCHFDGIEAISNGIDFYYLEALLQASLNLSTYIWLQTWLILHICIAFCSLISWLSCPFWWATRSSFIQIWNQFRILISQHSAWAVHCGR